MKLYRVTITGYRDRYDVLADSAEHAKRRIAWDFGIEPSRCVHAEPVSRTPAAQERA